MGIAADEMVAALRVARGVADGGELVFGQRGVRHPYLPSGDYPGSASDSSRSAASAAMVTCWRARSAARSPSRAISAAIRLDSSAMLFLMRPGAVIDELGRAHV